MTPPRSHPSPRCTPPRYQESQSHGDHPCPPVAILSDVPNRQSRSRRELGRGDQGEAVRCRGRVSVGLCQVRIPRSSTPAPTRLASARSVRRRVSLFFSFLSCSRGQAQLARGSKTQAKSLSPEPPGRNPRPPYAPRSPLIPSHSPARVQPAHPQTNLPRKCAPSPPLGRLPHPHNAIDQPQPRAGLPDGPDDLPPLARPHRRDVTLKKPFNILKNHDLHQPKSPPPDQPDHRNPHPSAPGPPARSPERSQRHKTKALASLP